MKVLTLSSLFPSSVRPSFGIFVETRLRHLVKDTGVDARVVAPVPWFPFTHAAFGAYASAARTPRYEDRNGLQVRHPRYMVIPKIGMRFAPGALCRAFVREAKALQAQGFDFDVIDAHYLFPDGVAAAKVGQALGKPVIMTARGSDVTEIARDYPRYRAQIMAAVETSAHVITVSESLRRELTEYGAPADKVTTLRNGVDCDRFQPTGCGPAPGDPKSVLFVGWLIPRKRPDLVLKAVAQLPNVRACLVGSGPEEARLRQLAAMLEIEDRVDFLGQQPPEAMPGHFTAADVLMLPSEREGWANVLLEAMACGTPVVSRAVDGALDLVTTAEAGTLVDSDAPEDYAQAISALLAAPPDRAQVRAYAETFTWREISMAQRTIFERAIHGTALSEQGE